MVRRRDSGWEADRGVCSVWRNSRTGKIVGIGEREERLGRRVEVRSRVQILAKMSWLFVERVVRGFERRMRVARLGVLLRKVISCRFVMPLEVRSSLVKEEIERVEDGVEGVSRGLKARDRV